MNKMLWCILFILFLVVLPATAIGQEGFYGDDFYNDSNFVVFSRATYRYTIGVTDIVISGVYVDGAEIMTNRSYQINIDIGALPQGAEIIITKNGAVEKATVPLENRYEPLRNILQYEHYSFITSPPGANVTFTFIYRNDTMSETFLTLNYDISDSIVLDDTELYSLLERRESRRRELEITVAEANRILIDEHTALGWAFGFLIAATALIILGVFYGTWKKTRAFMSPNIAATWDWNFFVVMLSLGIVALLVIVTDYSTLQNLFTYQYVEGTNVRATMANPYDIMTLFMHTLLYLFFLGCFMIGNKVGYRISRMPEVVHQMVIDTDVDPAMRAKQFYVDVTIKEHALMEDDNVVIPLRERVELSPDGEVVVKPLRFRDQARRLIWGAKRTCPKYQYLYPQRMRFGHWIRVEGKKGTMLNSINIKRQVDFNREMMMYETNMNELADQATMEDMQNVHTKEHLPEVDVILTTPKYRPVKRYIEKKRLLAKHNRLIMVFTPSHGMGNPAATMNDMENVTRSAMNAEYSDEMMGVYNRYEKVREAQSAGAYMAQSDTTPFENLTDEDETLSRQARGNRKYGVEMDKKMSKEFSTGDTFGA